MENEKDKGGMKETFRARTEGQGHVNVEMDSQQISGSTISTEGLTGCYVFLVSGLFFGIPFCYLNHHSYSPETTATTPRSLLLSMIEYLVECLIGEMGSFIGSAPVPDLIKSMSSLSLFIGGGIQQDPDTIRDAFALLQADGDLNLATADNCTIPPDQLRLILNQLHRNVIIINPVSYLLSDDLEDFAAEAGLLEDDLIQPVSVWIKFDCRTKTGNLGVHWKSPAGELDLALMEMTFAPINPHHNRWQLQSKEITAFQSSLKGDELQTNIFNEAMGYVQEATAESRSSSMSHDFIEASRSEEAASVRRRHSSSENSAATLAKKQRSSRSPSASQEDQTSNGNVSPKNS